MKPVLSSITEPRSMNAVLSTRCFPLSALFAGASHAVFVSFLLLQRMVKPRLGKVPVSFHLGH